MTDEWGPDDEERDGLPELKSDPRRQSEETFRAVLKVTLKRILVAIDEQNRAHAQLSKAFDSMREFRWKREGIGLFLIAAVPTTVQIAIHLLKKTP